jgi:hypothetical protein
LVRAVLPIVLEAQDPCPPTYHVSVKEQLWRIRLVSSVNDS